MVNLSGTQFPQSLLSITRRSRLLEFLIYGIGLRFYHAIRISKISRYCNLAMSGEVCHEDDLIPVRSGQYSIAIEPWPFAKTAAMTFSFDDLSPVNEPGFTDFGGNVEGPVVRRFERLMAQFPYIKVTHFTPARMYYDPIKARFSIGDNSIDDARFSQWRDWLKGWVSSGRVEVGLHGVYHYNRNLASPAEFDGLDYDDAKALMMESIELMLRAGFTPAGFRPPAWGLGNRACVVNAAKDAGLDYIAASGVDIGLNKTRKTVSDIVPSCYQGILNIPQNIILGLKPTAARSLVDAIIYRRGLISIKGHFADSYYLAASLNVLNFRWLDEFLRACDSMSDRIWFATMSEVASFRLAINSVKLVFRSDHMLTVKNESRIPIRGLTLRMTGDQPSIQGQGRNEDRVFVLPNILSRQMVNVDLPSCNIIA